EPRSVLVGQNPLEAVDGELRVDLQDLGPEATRFGAPPFRAVNRREVGAAHVGARSADEPSFEALRRVGVEPGTELRPPGQVYEEITSGIEAERPLEGVDGRGVAPC